MSNSYFYEQLNRGLNGDNDIRVGTNLNTLLTPITNTINRSSTNNRTNQSNRHSQNHSSSSNLNNSRRESIRENNINNYSSVISTVSGSGISTDHLRPQRRNQSSSSSSSSSNYTNAINNDNRTSTIISNIQRTNRDNRRPNNIQNTQINDEIQNLLGEGSINSSRNASSTTVSMTRLQSEPTQNTAIGDFMSVVSGSTHNTCMHPDDEKISDDINKNYESEGIGKVGYTCKICENGDLGVTNKSPEIIAMMQTMYDTYYKNTMDSNIFMIITQYYNDNYYNKMRYAYPELDIPYMTSSIVHYHFTECKKRNLIKETYDVIEKLNQQQKVLEINGLYEKPSEEPVTKRNIRLNVRASDAWGKLIDRKCRFILLAKGLELDRQRTERGTVLSAKRGLSKGLF